MQSNEFLRVKNFDKYQHYSKRKPPWIKLYFRLLSDPEFVPMSDASKMHTIAIMLLASQYDNKIPFNRQWISRSIQANSRINWDEIFASGFIICYQDASTMLYSCTRKSPTETETETETETDSAYAQATLAKNAAAPIVFCELPCSGNLKIFHVPTDYISEMKNLYPGVDIEKEVLRAKGWLVNNPRKQKTHDGMTRFLGSWFARVQNNGNGIKQPEPASPKPQRKIEWIRDATGKIDHAELVEEP
jgi:hypothetical protein